MRSPAFSRRPDAAHTSHLRSATKVVTAGALATAALVGCDAVLGLGSLRPFPNDAGGPANEDSGAGADASTDATTTPDVEAGSSTPDAGSGSCAIEGTTYPSGAHEGTNECLTCQPGVSASTWSNAGDGTSCGTGGICHAGECASGCEIGGVFVPANQTNTLNLCQICVPATSTTSWSGGPTDGQTCGDGGSLNCCGGSCTDEKTDDENCGGCGLACPSGCTSGECIVALFASDAGAGLLTLDDAGNIYFTTTSPDGGENVMRAPVKGGGPITTIVRGQSGIEYMSLANDSVYWTTSEGNVLSATADAGVPVTVASGQNFPEGVAANSTFVYWTTKVTGDVMEARFGGTTGPLATGQYFATDIALDSANVYWLTYTSPASVAQAALNGTGGVVTLDSTQNALFFGLTIDAKRVYWGDDNGAIHCANIGEPSSVTTLASGLFEPFDLAVDSSSVYWTNNDGTLMKVPLAGSLSPQTVPTGQVSASYIAVDESSLYFTSKEGLMRLTPK